MGTGSHSRCRQCSNRKQVRNIDCVCLENAFFLLFSSALGRKCAVAKKPFLKYRVLEVLSALCYFNGAFPVAEKNMA